jgi:Skp family chaperone for outer membrane proteins
VLTTSTAPAPSILSLQSSNHPREFRRWLGNAAIAFAAFVSPAFAPASLSAQQAEPTHQPGHRVALVDVAYIFKNLPAIKAHVSKLKGDLKKDELELKQRRDTLKQAVEQLKTLKVGSADYARREEYVANLESQLRLHRVHKHRGLNEAETRLYYDSYQQIAAALRAIATDNNIQLVLNFSSEEMDVEQNDSVVRGVMKNVVYHDSTVNMTNTVMRYLEQQANAPQAATSGNASSAISR